ncbi:MAG: C1 family peptidase [Devosia sp.]
MRRMKSAGLGALGAIALIVAMSSTGALSQEHRYATGASPTPDDVKQSIPEAPVYRDFLPQSVDLSKYMPPVGDQLNQGSCVGWATAYAARAYYAYQVEHRDTKLAQNIPSPAWLFNIIHIGNDCDQGSYVPDAMEVLKVGARSLADYPYDDTKCPTPLPPARLRANDFKIESYEMVWDQTKPDLDKVKGALAKGNPVVIIASLDVSFFDLNPRQSIWRSDAKKKDEGGHAFTLVGYDDATETFKFINSWNTGWGDKGYGRMTYDTFAARVYEGHIMHLPGDPEIQLADTDFVPDVVDTTPPAPPPFVPPLILKPTDATRDIAALDTNVDLGEIACGKVDVGIDADGNSIATGFVGSAKELDRIEDALKGKVDTVDVALAPWPACEVKLTLASQLAESDTPKVAVDPTEPKVDDQLNIGIQTPGFASYLYAAYFSADGNVVNVTQPTSLDLKPKAAHTIVRFGDDDAGQTSLKVSPPVGDELLLVVASERPLFSAALPDTETHRQFLSALREGVLSGDGGRITATLLPVTTAE